MAYRLNGVTIEGEGLNIKLQNRALQYGDGVFESIKFANNRINFWEDHYFRLMASMRILRMQIPASFSPEFLEEEIRVAISANGLETKSARVKIIVSRKDGGLYTPTNHNVDYLITVQEIENSKYVLNESGLTVELFTDYYKQISLLSSLKSTSCQLYTLASIFRNENGYDECFLLNDKKMLIEGISSNVFLLKGEELITPSIDDGCLKGVMRKNIIKIAQELDYKVVERSVTPFELQQADEVFLTNAINGLKWVKKYRKKTYTNELSIKLLEKLNLKVVLG